MGILEALSLGILQGITEFLPISSSGHLVLGEYFLGLNMSNLKSFDVVVHGGTLLAILVYFWKDIRGMLSALKKAVIGKLKWEDPFAKLIVFIIVGTIPAVLGGIFLEDLLDSMFRNITTVCLFMILVAVIFILGEKVHEKFAKKEILNWKKSFIVGIAQAIALIPGISRSGSTIVAGLFQGISRSEAARFSFLLGIPAISGALVLTFIKTEISAISKIGLIPLGIGFFSSFIFGLLSVSFLMKFLKNHSLRIFAMYRLLMGIGVLIYINFFV